MCIRSVSDRKRRYISERSVLEPSNPVEMSSVLSGQSLTAEFANLCCQPYIGVRAIKTCSRSAICNFYLCFYPYSVCFVSFFAERVIIVMSCSDWDIRRWIYRHNFLKFRKYWCSSEVIKSKRIFLHIFKLTNFDPTPQRNRREAVFLIKYLKTRRRKVSLRNPLKNRN